MKRIVYSILATLIILTPVISCAPAKSPAVVTPPEEPEVIQADTSPKEVYANTGVIPVIFVAGSNYDMGFQFGQQTADRVAHNVAVFKTALLFVYKGEERLTKGSEICDYYIKKHVPGMADWLRGIADGCKAEGVDISYLDLVLMNSFDVFIWAYPGEEYPDEAMQCTSYAATGSATTEGKPIIATTLMIGNVNIDKVILFAYPEDGNAFVATPGSGFVVHTSGMNIESLAWIVTALPQVEPIWALPAIGIGYQLCQYIDSPAEAEEWMAKVERGGSTGNFILGDRTGYVSVFESNSQHHAIRYPGDLGEKDFVINTNHFVIEEMKPYNFERYKNSPHSPYRYATAWQYFEKAAEKSEIDVEFFKEVTKTNDWYDPEKKEWHYNDPSSPNVIGNDRIDSTIIFYPSQKTMYFSTGWPGGVGTPPFSTGEYAQLKLISTPQAVAGNAGNTAYSMFRAARHAYIEAKNAKATYLTYPVCESIEAKLDKAALEWELGHDRAGFAGLEKDDKTRLRLLSDAATHYCNAQVYAQEVSTILSEWSSK